MKTLPKQIIEIESEGMLSLLGEKVLILSFNYFYYGKLVGVNETCIKLEEVYKVFEIGDFSEKKFKDAQKLSVDAWYIQLNSIESFGKSFKTV